MRQQRCVVGLILTLRRLVQGQSGVGRSLPLVSCVGLAPSVQSDQVVKISAVEIILTANGYMVREKAHAACSGLTNFRRFTTYAVFLH